ncbi:hypothetical protein ACFQFC_24695 [Amorphoplanes digitatis]|uniref:Uncharacterized protein n=1 Tax=Actinoplanes digitatis TaxID=1868 RepID=A0A7W7MUF4_9ACTN|nr:hypothetical protein [Actinoplanes digitatis]MBB4767421.1 hypothetical protein [Actinoplanes digitatis]GID98365.1 hypothetical protein Adi01nite_77770 [Actinoplanes digitatis]
MTHATGTRTGQAGSRARPTFRGFVDDDSDAVVTVRAFDAAGNMASLTTTVHVDNKVPKLAGLSPAVGTVMRTGPIDIALAEVAADAVKVEMTEGQRGASLVTKTETPWTFHWEGLDKTESPCFRATDKAGNGYTMCSEYIVDDGYYTRSVLLGRRHQPHPADAARRRDCPYRVAGERRPYLHGAGVRLGCHATQGADRHHRRPGLGRHSATPRRSRSW